MTADEYDLEATGDALLVLQDLMARDNPRMNPELRKLIKQLTSALEEYYHTLEIALSRFPESD